MPLTIDDGSGVAGANSYVTVAEFDQWLSGNGYTAPADTGVLLRRAYLFMSVLPWCESHAGAYTVTDSHKMAQMAIAYAVSTGFDPFSVVGSQKLKRKKIDVLEKEWFPGGYGDSPDSQLRRVPVAAALLDGLICSAGLNNFELVR